MKLLIDKLYLLYEEKCNHDHPNQIRIHSMKKILMFKKINEWNDPCDEITLYCSECKSCNLEITDSGKFKGISWISYICLDCGNKDSNEPDYD